MFSKEWIFRQLEELGCPRDGVVLVHSSLRAIGETEGRGEGLLEMLMEYVTGEGGLLCVPTHTWANLSPKKPITLDLQSNETCIGMLPTIAAGHPRAIRTENPSHSMAVFGEGAAAFAALDQAVETPAAPEGCYAEVARREGFILLLGVGQERNTFLHAAEEMLIGNRRLTEGFTEMTIRRKNGELVLRKMREFDETGIGDVSKRFPKFEPAFRAFGAIRDGKVGNAAAQLCDAKKMLAAMERIYQRAEGRELLADMEPLEPTLYQ